MKNFVQPGNVVTVPAPTGGASSGEGILVGSIFGVAAYGALEGYDVELSIVGIYALPKKAEAVSVGDPLYWDDTAGALTKLTSPADALVGVATKAADAGASTVNIRLLGQTQPVA